MPEEKEDSLDEILDEDVDVEKFGDRDEAVGEFLTIKPPAVQKPIADQPSEQPVDEEDDLGDVD